MIPGAGSSELAPVFLFPCGAGNFHPANMGGCAAGAAVWPRQSGSRKQRRRATGHLWGRFSTKRKNRGHKITPLHIGRGLCPPLWPWAVDRENRGQYSLEHGAAVIPPCILGHGQGITPCQALNIEIRKSQEFTGVLLVLCFRRDLQDKQGTAEERRRA